MITNSELGATRPSFSGTHMVVPQTATAFACGPALCILSIVSWSASGEHGASGGDAGMPNMPAPAAQVFAGNSTNNFRIFHHAA